MKFLKSAGESLQWELFNIHITAENSRDLGRVLPIL